MATGIANSSMVILFMSEGVLTRPFVIFELEQALKAQKQILLIHEQDQRHNPFEFAREVSLAPEWLRELVESHESLPWQRRGYLREALLDQLTTKAGFAPMEAMPIVAEEEQG